MNKSQIYHPEGPEEGISIPLKLFNPQFPFVTFFPILNDRIPLHASGLNPIFLEQQHPIFSVAPLVVNKSAYLLMNSCMYPQREFFWQYSLENIALNFLSQVNDSRLPYNKENTPYPFNISRSFVLLSPK